MYGLGEKQDYRAAFSWYLQSANQNLPLGQYNVGICFYNGFGVKQDKQAAYTYFKKAASYGNHEAIVALDNLF